MTVCYEILSLFYVPFRGLTSLPQGPRIEIVRVFCEFRGLDFGYCMLRADRVRCGQEVYTTSATGELCGREVYTTSATDELACCSIGFCYSREKIALRSSCSNEALLSIVFLKSASFNVKQTTSVRARIVAERRC